MSADVMCVGDWSTNALMIKEAVVPLGYIGDEVIDLSFGESGGFWTEWQPPSLTTNDNNPEVAADHHHDVSQLVPLDWLNRWDTAVWDGDYKLKGGTSTAMSGLDSRYGLNRPYKPVNSVMDVLADGVRCAIDITRPKGTVLVKCQDQIVSGGLVEQTRLLTLIAETHGARLVDRFHKIYTPLAQPKMINGTPRRQVHARNNYSTLLVFKKLTPPRPPQTETLFA